MPDADLRLRHGTLLTPAGPVSADLLIRGERISAIVEPADPAPAADTVDVTGLHVFPGVVDLHAHTRVPGYDYKEDYLTCSQAAAVGGVTTIVDMPNVEPPTDDVRTFEDKRSIAADQCMVDWGHLVGGTKTDQIPLLAAAGATGFKIFQVSGGYPHDPRLALGEPEKMYVALDAIAKTGLHCSVHPFNQPIMDLLTERALAAGRQADMRTFADIYTADIVWRSGVVVLLELQRETNARLHLLHTHAAGSLRAIRRAKLSGQAVTCAIDPKYYHLTDLDLDEQGARAIPGGSVTRDEERMAEIWRSLQDGNVDMIDSDHAPHTIEDLKRFEDDPWTGPFGSPQYEYILSLVLTDVAEGRFALDHAVRLLSENPARLIGRFPQKGALQVGSDADIVVVDLDRDVVPSDEETFTKVRWTPYRGRRLKGAPVLTIRRGEIIARDRKVLARPGSGRYLEGVPQEVRPPAAGGQSPGLLLRARTS
jgi:dihydroorotase (multifunctional complex type)